MDLCGLVNGCCFVHNLCLLYRAVPFVYLTITGSYSGLVSKDLLLGDSIRRSEVRHHGGLESYIDTCLPHSPNKIF